MSDDPRVPHPKEQEVAVRHAIATGYEEIIDKLRAELAAVTAERDALVRRLAEVEQSNDIANAACVKALNERDALKQLAGDYTEVLRQEVSRLRAALVSVKRELTAALSCILDMGNESGVADSDALLIRRGELLTEIDTLERPAPPTTGNSNDDAA